MTLLVATTVGVAAFLMNGFEYRASVDLVATQPATSTALDRLRRSLLDYTWQTLGESGSHWWIDLDPQAAVLRVTLSTADRRQACSSLDRLAASFLQHHRTSLDRARTELAPDERLLTQLREERAAELAALTTGTQRIAASLPAGDVAAATRSLREELAARRAAYAQNRRRAQDLQAELDALGAAPLPDRAPVDPEERERAIRADIEVQQDLKALRVQLAEVRHELSAVGLQTAPTIEAVGTTTEQFESLCNGPEARDAPVELRRAVERMGASVADYRTLLGEFARAWSVEFERLAAAPDDPRRPEVLDVQNALSEVLNGYSFGAAASLGAIREQVRVVSEASASPAEQHEFTSALLRTFHALQSAHQRLEFTAADVKPTNNFRLDAALKSAKGLRHRSQQRLTRIDEQLAQQALDALRAERERRMTALKEERDALRQTLDGSVETLLAAQDEADAHAPALEQFVQGKTTAGVNAERIKTITAELQRIDRELANAAAERTDVIAPENLQAAPSRLARWPVNLGVKLLQGALAGLVVLTLLVAVQTSLAPRTT
jgi:hypothetical protein